MRNWKLIALAFFLGSVLGCTKGDPKLAGSLDFDGLSLSSNSISISSPNSIITVAGTCDPRVSEIQVSLDSGQTWKEVTGFATTSSVLCTTAKTFTFSLDPNAPGMSSYLSYGSDKVGTKGIQVRGITKIGPSLSKVYAVIFDFQVPQKGPVIVSGTSPMNGPGGKYMVSATNNYKLLGRVGVPNVGNSQTSSSYVLKTGLQNPE